MSDVQFVMKGLDGRVSCAGEQGRSFFLWKGMISG